MEEQVRKWLQQEFSETYKDMAEECGAIMPEEWVKPEIEAEIKAIRKKLNLKNFDLIAEDEIPDKSKSQVVDLTDLDFTTVDPKDCQDMDDAIFTKVDENGDYVVYVAIANVAKAVDLNSRIGQLYLKGGFTFYTPLKAYHILPTELSSEICSLSPNEVRHAFVSKIVIDYTTGKPIERRERFYDAIIKSKAKLSYEQAEEMCEGVSKEQAHQIYQKSKAGKQLSLEEQVLLNKLAGEKIREAFIERGYICFEHQDEFEIGLDDQGRFDYQLKKRLDYQNVIEEFMITANEAVARFCYNNNIPNIYRIHNEPNGEQAQNILAVGRQLRILEDEDDAITPALMHDMLTMARRRKEDISILSDFLLRNQNSAGYELGFDDSNCQNGELPVSHFALQSTCYCHSTSPIRRICDYFTLYNIQAYLAGKEGYSIEELKNVLDPIRARRQAVDDADKKLGEIHSQEFLKSCLNKVITGEVYDFIRFKGETFVIARIKGIKVDVRVPYGEERCDIENCFKTTIGHKTYKLGDKIRFVLSEDEKNKIIGIEESLWAYYKKFDAPTSSDGREL